MRSTGRMRRRLRIEAEVRTPDGMGGTTGPTWSAVSPVVYAEEITKPGRERFEAHQVDEQATVMFRIRYRSMTGAHRAVDVGENIAYNVRSVVPDERRKFLTPLIGNNRPHVVSEAFRCEGWRSG